MSNPQDGGARPTDLRSRWREMRERRGLDRPTPGTPAAPVERSAAPPVEPAETEPVETPQVEPVEAPPEVLPQHAAAASVLAAFRETDNARGTSASPAAPHDDPEDVLTASGPLPSLPAEHAEHAEDTEGATAGGTVEAPDPLDPLTGPIELVGLDDDSPLGRRDPEPGPEAPAQGTAVPPVVTQNSAAASVLAALQPTEPEPEPEPEPDPEPEAPAADLYPGQAADPDRPPLPPEDTAGRHISTAPPATTAPDQIAASVVEAFRRPEPESDPEPEPGDGASPTAAASPLVAAARRVEEERAAAAAREEEESTAADAAEEQGPVGRRTRDAASSPAEERTPLRVEFASPRTGQITATLFIVAGLLVTAGMAWVAYDTRDVADAALAGVAAVLTLVVWGVRAGSAPSTVVIDRGVLHITRGTSTSSFDLTNVQLDVEEHGTAGQRGWRLQIHRRSLGPVTIDRSMVDPVAFMQAVRRYRRDL